jgi:flagellar basal body rod protein FlgG
MDTTNRPIQLSDQAPFRVDPDGTIGQKGAIVARIQVVSVPDRAALSKAGRGMFRAPADAMASLKPATGLVRQGVVEGSSVDPVRAMMDITDAGRDAEANFSMISTADRIMERAINGLGRVA